MKKSFIISVFAAATLLAGCAGNKTKSDVIKEAADKLFAVTDTIKDVTIQSVMILKDGNIVYKRWANGGEENTPHVMHSVSKSFCATAVGMAVDEGKPQNIKYLRFLPAHVPTRLKPKVLPKKTAHGFWATDTKCGVVPKTRTAPTEQEVSTLLFVLTKTL